MRICAEGPDSRIPKSKKIPVGQKAWYYSSIKNTIVHLFLALRLEGEIEEIARATGLDSNEVRQIIDELLRIGLVELRAGKFHLTDKRVHIEAGDPSGVDNHKNFRLQAIKFIESRRQGNLHFSMAFAISEKVTQIIRDQIMKRIDANEKIIAKSKEEVVMILNIDLAKLG